MSPFLILGLSPDADVASVRRAYAGLLRTARPEDDPAAFQRLREARDAALAVVAVRERQESLRAEILAQHLACTPGAVNYDTNPAGDGPAAARVNPAAVSADPAGRDDPAAARANRAAADAAPDAANDEPDPPSDDPLAGDDPNAVGCDPDAAADVPNAGGDDRDAPGGASVAVLDDPHAADDGFGATGDRNAARDDSDAASDETSAAGDGEGSATDQGGETRGGGGSGEAGSATLDDVAFVRVEVRRRDEEDTSELRPPRRSGREESVAVRSSVDPHPRPPPTPGERFAAAAGAVQAEPQLAERWAALREAVQALPVDAGTDAEASVIAALHLLPERPTLAVTRELARLSVLYGWAGNDTALRRALGRAGAEAVAMAIARGQLKAPWSGDADGGSAGKRPRFDRNGIVDVPLAALAAVLGPGSAAVVGRYRAARVAGRWRMHFRVVPFVFGPVWLATRGVWRAAYVAWAMVTLAWTLVFLSEVGVSALVGLLAKVLGVLLWLCTRAAIALRADRLSVQAAAEVVANGGTVLGFDRRGAKFFAYVGLGFRSYFGLFLPVMLALAIIGAIEGECTDTSTRAECLRPIEERNDIDLPPLELPPDRPAPPTAP